MEHEVTPALMDQIARQCDVVRHLARSLADVHEDYASIFRSGDKGPEHIAEIVGNRTAALMEKLGDMLNGMDACDESDEWTEPVFREAQRLWPQRAELASLRSKLAMAEKALELAVPMLDENARFLRDIQASPGLTSRAFDAATDARSALAAIREGE